MVREAVERERGRRIGAASKRRGQETDKMKHAPDDGTKVVEPRGFVGLSVFEIDAPMKLSPSSELSTYMYR